MLLGWAGGFMRPVVGYMIEYRICITGECEFTIYAEPRVYVKLRIAVITSRRSPGNSYATAGTFSNVRKDMQKQQERRPA